ncbi:MAG: 1-deoxy-D-xylulose-5-phosphate reductoisomerase [Alistipes sp.]|nr:1-deoxy-D-xylulose-5-phosphate reductoisomerase [Alistipes sp.]
MGSERVRAPRQRVAILGSTGSIGEQTIEVLRRHPDLFEATTLTAHRNWRRLAAQARLVEPDSVVIADSAFYEPLRDALSDLPIKVWAGEGDVAAVAAASGVDVVVNALVGWAGLVPTISAIEAGKKLALANKESLVVAGETVMRLAREKGVPIVPIDSEHSAILQCLVGEFGPQRDGFSGESPVRRLILTASGGALRDVPPAELVKVTAAQALKHPNWSMGAKITIDSATMVNKGFEVVEARWLFDVPAEKIDVLIHPQSIVHSMVEFCDGAVKAQLGTPDMRVPISYALSFPHRLPAPESAGSATSPGSAAEFSLTDLTFREVDHARYPALGLTRDCLAAGGTALCTMNAANEAAVAAFLDGRIGYLDIVRVIHETLDRAENVAKPTLEDYIACNEAAKTTALQIINR